jgi:hypothetical protein
MLNTLDMFYIYRETLNNNQLNDKNTVMPKTIFDVVIRHCGDSTYRI